MSKRGLFYVIQQSMPRPAWVRWPEQQRFCCCCSIRTGASLIGWFNFIINSFYIGTLALGLTGIRNLLSREGEPWSEPESLRGAKLVNDSNVTSHVININSTEDTPLEAYPAPSEEITNANHYLKNFVLPMMFKSLAVPAIMIIFSVLWLITVEAKTLSYVRWFGRAFITCIVIQLFMQLGFLIYAEYRLRFVTNNEHGISWIIWLVFAVYTALNIYFVPVLSEYIGRRIRESKQGLEQGLLTDEMYPKSRVAEAYIEDAFTLEGDADIIRFQSSLEAQSNPPTTTEERNDDDGYQPI